MIEKKIHYIWLGGKKKSNLINICINSWKEKLPDYEIIEWNESNLDLEKIQLENKFFRECMKRKLWAYMADYLRLKILYEQGGIYFDTDIQVLKSFDSLLEDSMFLGKEVGNHFGTGVIAAESHNNLIKELLDFYTTEIWKKNIYTIPLIFDYVINRNPKKFSDIKVYPMEYFAPIDYRFGYRDSDITEKTITIHWFDGSWKDNKQVYLFLQTKHIDNCILRRLTIIKKLIGYYYRKIKRIMYKG